jgi:predicted porin
VKRTFISAAAILAFTAAGHADELSDIQAQAKQIQQQNQVLTKRLADLEKRQKAIEAQSKAQPVAATANPVDALAADLPYKAAVKAPAPIDDALCWHGVCLYGNLDGGVEYNQHGSPVSPMSGFALNAPIEKSSFGSQFAPAANQSSTSFIGLRGKQEIAENLYAVFNLQTLFNPFSGMNANGIGSVAANNGFGQAPQLGTLANAYGDSSKAGQMFNQAAYFGVSSPTYGTLTMGRQSSLSSDLIVNYDALSGANAWSLFTNEGAVGGGGNTENRVYDNAYEYRLNVGPVRLAVETQLRNGNNSAVGNAFEGNVGFDYMGFSFDALGGKAYNSVSFAGGPLSTAQVVTLQANQSVPGGNGLGYAIPCNLGCLPGTVSDNTIFEVAGRYTIGPWKLYAGYQHITKSNPDNPLQPGATVQGGYSIAFVNNNNYFTNGQFNNFWVGTKYSILPTLDIAVNYYHFGQGYFTAGSGATAAIGGGLAAYASRPGQSIANLNQAAACAANSAASTGCAGAEDMIGMMVDWRFARHMDFYAGVAYSQRNGGPANAFITSNNNSILTAAQTAACNNGTAGCPLNSKVSTFNPGIGLRYQF